MKKLLIIFILSLLLTSSVLSVDQFMLGNTSGRGLYRFYNVVDFCTSTGICLSNMTTIFNPTNYYNKTASDNRYLQSYTESDPIFVASNSSIWYDINLRLLTSTFTNENTSIWNTLNLKLLASDQRYNDTATIPVSVSASNTSVNTTLTFTKNNGETFGVTFLSNVGPTGATGATGASGTNGVNGTSPYITSTTWSNGNFTINWSNGNQTISPDLTGPTGASGNGTFSGTINKSLVINNPAFCPDGTFQYGDNETGRYCAYVNESYLNISFQNLIGIPAACSPGSAITDLAWPVTCSAFLTSTPYQSSAAGWVNTSSTTSTSLKVLANNDLNVTGVLTVINGANSIAIAHKSSGAPLNIGSSATGGRFGTVYATTFNGGMSISNITGLTTSIGNITFGTGNGSLFWNTTCIGLSSPNGLNKIQACN